MPSGIGFLWCRKFAKLFATAVIPPAPATGIEANIPTYPHPNMWHGLCDLALAVKIEATDAYLSPCMLVGIFQPYHISLVFGEIL